MQGKQRPTTNSKSRVVFVFLFSVRIFFSHGVRSSNVIVYKKRNLIRSITALINYIRNKRVELPRYWISLEIKNTRTQFYSIDRIRNDSNVIIIQNNAVCAYIGPIKRPLVYCNTFSIVQIVGLYVKGGK